VWTLLSWGCLRNSKLSKKLDLGDGGFGASNILTKAELIPVREWGYF